MKSPPVSSSVPSAMRSSFAFLTVICASFFLGACQTQYIPNTDVSDSPRNRDVIEFCESYRRAVELGKIGAILALADAGYYEDGGNIDASDDIDYAGLRDFLETRFRDTVAIRYDVRYRKVSDDPAGMVFVDYTYSASYKIPAPEGERWKRSVGDNRLILVPYQDTYRIRAGM